MKIAVYTIALNEEKHVKRWYESAKDADLLVIADTGSTDKTQHQAKSLGISVTEIEVKPWRFDVARNASLALIPEDFDICIQLDMDEVLPAGWRKKVEEAFEQGNSWPKYTMVMSRDSDGNPRNFYHHFRIHPRRGFFWKYPIHEVLTHAPELSFERKVIDLEIDHLQDKSKSRKSYLNLLETAVEEYPNDWRMNHYLNREYFYNRDWLKVLQSSYKCESIIGGWDIERASTYMWASEAAHHLKMPSLAEDWAKKATEAASLFYEVWHWRAHIAHLNGKWEECLEFSRKRLILKRQNHHLIKPEVWEWWGFDLIALSNHKLGIHDDAIKYGKIALDFLPFEERLNRNLEFYLGAKERSIASDSLVFNTQNPITFLKGKSVKVLDTFFVPFSRWDYMSDFMLKNGFWDIQVTNWLVSNVKPGWRCINVGSNSGYFLEVLSRLAKKNGKVIGFEPNVELVKQYRDTKSLNDYSNCAPIEIYEVALGENRDESDLFIPKANIGGASLSSEAGLSLTGFIYPTIEARKVRVPVIPLNEFVNDQYDLILIDVEGSEESVFNGFSEALTSTPYIIIELGSYHSDKFLNFLYERYFVKDFSGNEVPLEFVQDLESGSNINVLLQYKFR